MAIQLFVPTAASLESAGGVFGAKFFQPWSPTVTEIDDDDNGKVMGRENLLKLKTLLPYLLLV